MTKLFNSKVFVVFLFIIKFGLFSPIGDRDEWNNSNGITNKTLMKLQQMVLDDIRDLHTSDGPDQRTPRNAVRNQGLLWPGGVVYYDFEPNQYDVNQINTILMGFREIRARTCIKFVRRTTQENYVNIKKTGKGCYSHVGMTGGVQVVSLDDGCVYHGIVIHEIMHALGFFHEQSRSDRDDYVTIKWENIIKDRAYNFHKYGQEKIQHLGAAYDYGSIMHYGKYAFAINDTVPTIITPPGVEIGQLSGLSRIDALKIRALYGCTSSQIDESFTKIIACLLQNPSEAKQCLLEN